MRKRFTALILILLMCLTLMPIGAFAADVVDSGKCGDNATWSLDSAGTLTISGSGEIYDYTESLTEPPTTTAPWAKYSNDIKKVVIGDGITHVGAFAFSCLPQLISVTIPSSLVSSSIAYDFSTNITDVYISDIAAWCNIEIYHSSANPLCHAKNLYVNNELVTDLIIPDGVTTINAYAFAYCSGIKTVTIPASVKEIGWLAFDGIDSDNHIQSITFKGDAPESKFGGTLYDADLFNPPKPTIYAPKDNSTWLDPARYDSERGTFDGCPIEFYDAVPDSPDDGGSSDNFFSRLLDTIRNIFRSLFSWLPFC